MPLARSVRYAALSALLPAVCGCELLDQMSDDSTAGVGITLEFPGWVSHAHLAVGDRDTVRAVAQTGGWPSRVKYDSANEPRRFRYSSSNASVASVDEDGVVRAITVGATELVASVDGISSLPMRLAVSPPASSLRAEPALVAALVGDSFAISIKALNSTGQSVSGVIFNVGLDTTQWAVTSQPREGDWQLHTPIVLHFQAKMAGHVRITATVSHERAESRFQASVPVEVRSP